MREATVRRLAWSAFLLWVFLFLGSSGFSIASALDSHGTGGHAGEVVFGISTGAFAIVAILILARQPRNPIGWILMGIGLG